MGGLDKKYNPTKDEGQKRSIQSKQQDGIDLDGLKDALDAYMVDVTYGEKNIEVSDPRATNSEIPS